MNHKIAAYIEMQRNAPLFTEVNDESSPIQKAGKAGQEFEHDMLTAMNNDGLFDEPTNTTIHFKFLVVLAVIVNVCLFLSRGNS